MEAIVLAGGLGTRLRSVVSDVPKPMAPVGGRPFLERLLEYWIGQGVSRFVLSVGYLAERIVGHFGRAWAGADIEYVQESGPLGTGGGLLLAAERVRAEEFVAMNGDSFFGVALKDLADFHARHRSDWTLALHRSSDARRYMGLSVGPEGRVAALNEQSPDGHPLVNGGVYIVRRGVLAGLPWKSGDRLSLETDLLPHGLKAGWSIHGLEVSRPFVDIGVPEDYLRAGEIAELRGMTPPPLVR